MKKRAMDLHGWQTIFAPLGTVMRIQETMDPKSLFKPFIHIEAWVGKKME